MQITVPRRREPTEPLPGRCADLDLFADLGRWRSRQEVYCQDTPVEYRYRMVTGAARRFAIQRSGRRQIVDFLLPGDFFGFASRRVHSFSVEAIADETRIARYPIAQLERSATDPRIGRQIRDAGAAESARLQARILVLAQMTALERVQAFLLEMAARSPDGSDGIALPMSRYDVADYLALSVETVCRALSRLRSRGAIAFAGKRRIRILDRGLLDGHSMS